VIWFKFRTSVRLKNAHRLVIRSRFSSRSWFALSSHGA